MSDPIAARLALLPKLSKTDLHDFWKELFQKAPPPQLRKDLMIPILVIGCRSRAWRCSAPMRDGDCPRLHALSKPMVMPKLFLRQVSKLEPASCDSGGARYISFRLRKEHRKANGLDESYVRRIVSYAFLAPDIVHAILTPAVFPLRRIKRLKLTFFGISSSSLQNP
jgi:hypothetical protein